MPLPRILITPGEPAGIGPDVVIQAAQLNWPVELIAITDPAVLTARANTLHLPLKLIECSLNEAARIPHQPGTLRVCPTPFPAGVTAGKLDAHHAAAVIQTLRLAADACLSHKADAVVTGPVQKSIINDAGIAFTGHTEFFAEAAGVKQTVMLFVLDQIKAALVTTHLSLASVPTAITADKIIDVCTILQQGLKQYFHLETPHLLVAGLNPHAGENGLLGKEELSVITPALEKLRQQGMLIKGPLPADTIFTPSVLSTGDAVLGMYHDQILPVIKFMGFDRAVNMTLGLPFIRTSVDHGTALDIAGTGQANPGSLIAAIKLAISTQPSSND